jgi:hypothetical protein
MPQTPFRKCPLVVSDLERLPSGRGLLAWDPRVVNAEGHRKVGQQTTRGNKPSAAYSFVHCTKEGIFDGKSENILERDSAGVAVSWFLSIVVVVVVVEVAGRNQDDDEEAARFRHIRKNH